MFVNQDAIETVFYDSVDIYEIAVLSQLWLEIRECNLEKKIIFKEVIEDQGEISMVNNMGISIVGTSTYDSVDIYEIGSCHSCNKSS